MDPVAPPPAQPAAAPTTPRQYALHVAGALIAALATALYTKYTTPPAQTPTPVTIPAQTAPNGVVLPTPVADGKVVVPVLRIEAGRVEFTGTVQVNIPEIKVPAAPDVIVENKLPPEVTAALLKQPPAPVVNVRVNGNPATVEPDVLEPQRLPDPTAAPVQPAPKKQPDKAAPVRVLPTINK